MEQLLNPGSTVQQRKQGSVAGITEMALDQKWLSSHTRYMQKMIIISSLATVTRGKSAYVREEEECQCEGGGKRVPA